MGNDPGFTMDYGDRHIFPRPFGIRGTGVYWQGHHLGGAGGGGGWQLPPKTKVDPPSVNLPPNPPNPKK